MPSGSVETAWVIDDGTLVPDRPRTEVATVRRNGTGLHTMQMVCADNELVLWALTSPGKQPPT